MRPGESAILPFGQSNHRSPPGARSAVRQLRQLAVLSRWLGPIIWIPQPWVPIQHPWVPGRPSPGPPRSDPRLSRTSHPAASSPVSAGVRQVPLSLAHSASSVCARSQRPTSSQAAPQFVPGPRPYLEIAPHCHSLARGLASSPILPGGLTRPKRHLRPSWRSPPASSTIFSLRASSTRSPARGHSPDLGPAPVCYWGHPHPVAQSPCASAVRDRSWAPPAPPAPPLPLESLHGTSRCSAPSSHSPLRFAAPRKASGPPQPAAPSMAATPVSGPPPVFFWGRPLPVTRPPCASVRLSRARSPLGPQAPAGTSAATGEPARRLPLLCAVRALTTSIRGNTQGRGLCHVLRPTDSEVPDGQIPALPELPRRPTHARPPPLVVPRSLELNRPGEGSLPTLYSPAPPELTIQACAIFRSLATPPNCYNMLDVRR
ncbi:hypothetical protein NDU88_001369 [Pleurodeles waltl]|uniref:Basic proline-rich protein-like n=1 Tax=Pleurodeles waltl TaxID=8319 RepID=A0AAV7WI50_PLEWA|nr:hypothetical protein NDU88_001369 [Pleurodeles waltl]